MKNKIMYGREKSQYGELYLDVENCHRGVVCIIHGGAWMMPYNLHQFDALSKKLMALGYAVWNIEYRRVGELNRHWEDTFKDVVSAANHLNELKTMYPQLNLEKIILVGHSAGGHLAMLLNTAALEISVNWVIGLAPVLDLVRSYNENEGGGAVKDLLMGSPSEVPLRYEAYSPIKKDRKRAKETILHGDCDELVPIEWSRDYVHLISKNHPVEFYEMRACGHMDFIDSESEATKFLIQLLV